VLVWPTYSFAGNVGADSLYLIARNLIRASAEGECFWTLIVPDLPSVPVDDLDARCDVVKVRMPMGVLYRMQEAAPDPEIVWRYAPQDGPRPVDVLVSMSPARTLNVANAWSMRTPAAGRPVLVNWDLLVRDDGSGEMTTDEVELMQQAAGCWAADLNVFESPIARKMALSVARKHLSPSAVRKVVDSSLDVAQGIDVASLDEAIRTVPRREKFTVYYGGRFSTSKRVNDLAEVIDAFYRFGRDVQFVVTTGSLDGNKRAKFEARFPQVELHVGLSQEDAWRVMASCHASICFSTHELFGMAFWEQIAAGLDVVMQAAKWNADLLPPDYPWVCRGPLEAGAMLRQIHETWQENPDRWEHQGCCGPGEWVKTQYDSDMNCALIVGHLIDEAEKRQNAAEEGYSGGSRKELAALVQSVLPESGTVTLDDLVRDVREASRVGKNVVGSRLKWAKSNSMLDLVRITRWLGWHDDDREGVPAFTKGAGS
jgi:hypothetical protein